MRNSILSAVLFSLIAIISTNTYATEWSSWQEIQTTYTHSNGTIFIYSPSHINPAGCRSSRPYAVAPDAVNHQEVYQMALSATATGMNTSAYISGISCQGSYPRVLHLRVTK